MNQKEMISLVLPKEFIKVKIIKGRIVPNFIENENDIKKLFEIWRGSLGKKKREIKERFKIFENSSNYKMVRGYFHILCGISEFKEIFKEAGKLREFLFGLGPAIYEEDRKRIIQKAQEVFRTKISPDMIWGDLEENLILEKFPNITLEETIKIYNLALLNGIALLSHKIKFRTQNIGEILRFAKKLKLMYDIDQDGWIYIFGPESIISESPRYKIQILKCFQKIIRNKNSNLILETKKGYFNMLPEYYKYIPEIESPEESFDSKIEEEISKLIKDAMPYISIEREADIFISKSGVFIPDFKVKNKEKELFIEIVGFWTKQYIEKKIEKLSDFKKDIMIIASEENSLEIREKIPDNKNLIVFGNKIPHLEIIKRIKEAVGYQFPKEENDQDILKIKDEIKDGMEFTEASEIIKKRGLNVIQTLRKIGFDVIWESLVPPKGKLKKKY